MSTKSKTRKIRQEIESINKRRKKKKTFRHTKSLQ